MNNNIKSINTMKYKIKYKYLHFIFHFYYSPLSPIKKKIKQFIFVYKKTIQAFKHKPFDPVLL